MLEDDYAADMASDATSLYASESIAQEQNNLCDTSNSYLLPPVPTYHLIGLSSDLYAIPYWPPPNQAAREGLDSASSEAQTTQITAFSMTDLSGNELDQAAAAAPGSFHNRSLQLALPQIQYDIDEGFDESLWPTPDLRSGISLVEGPDDIDGIPSSYNDALAPCAQSSHNSNFGSHNLPTQYHRIATNDGEVPDKEIVPGSYPAHETPTSGEIQTLACHLCTYRQFTGVWAHRNLTRHMESVHAPYTSPDGVRHFRCSHHDCPRTFRRVDARLVHERRSHPELNRPPPTPRKKSGDLSSSARNQSAVL